MKRKRLLLLFVSTCLVLALAVAPFMACAKPAPEVAPEVAALQKEIASLEKEIAKLKEPAPVVKAEVIKMKVMAGTKRDLYFTNESRFAVCELLNRVSQGRIETMSYGMGDLYSTYEDALPPLLAGDLDFLWVDTCIVPSLAGIPEESIACDFPIFGVDWQTWADNYMEFWKHPNGGQKLEKLYEAKGFKFFGCYVYAPYQICVSKPVTSQADLKGVKIRVPGGELPKAVISAIGATPAAISFAEYPVALKTGVIDGVYTDGLTVGRAKVWELGAPYRISNVEPYCAVYGLYGSLKGWNKLPSDLQALIESAMPMAVEYGNKTGMENRSRYFAATEANMTTCQLSDEALKQATKQIGDLYAMLKALDPEMYAVRASIAGLE